MNCAPEGWVYNIPSFIHYFKNGTAAEGEHYVALIAGNERRGYYRTFIRSRVICALRKDQLYRISFYIKTVHKIADSVGIYFTPYDFLFEKKQHNKIEPAVYAVDGIQKAVLNDTNWQRIVVDYKAKGDETYITIGNFSKRMITGETGLGLESNFYFLIDNISLYPLDPKETICDQWQNVRDEVYDQNERHEFQTRRVTFYKSKKPPEPTKAGLTKMQVVDTLIIPDILFDVASANLRLQSHQMLDSFSKKLTYLRIDSIIVNGHTDNTGSYSSNQTLSENRAITVADYILSKIVLKSSLITSRGFASDKPVADNKTPAGRQKNRRVEILVYRR